LGDFELPSSRDIRCRLVGRAAAGDKAREEDAIDGVGWREDVAGSSERRRFRGFNGGVGRYSSSVASPSSLSTTASSSESKVGAVITLAWALRRKLRADVFDWGGTQGDSSS
jgi:hypothetical protein